jgi:predicted alpha/beta-fold hydrolase
MEPFEPAWWCRGPHRQTLWAALARRPPAVRLRRERLELPDGDFLDLDWAADRPSGPRVLLLHGLEGSARSNYARGMLAALTRLGFRPALLHFRGCSGEPNRLDRSYHSGETGDLDRVVRLLRAREPSAPLAVVGYSLGGNVLLKWLGEQGERAPVQAAVAVSVPFVLEESVRRMARGLSRLYQWRLLAALRRSLRRKFDGRPAPIAPAELARLRDFRTFDERVTAPLHGFGGAAHYYRAASCRPYLARIAVPTLIVHAADDPFLTAAAIPAAHELAPPVRLELSARGGHVGFVAGRWPWRARYWLEERVPAWLQQQLSSSQGILPILPSYGKEY